MSKKKVKKTAKARTIYRPEILESQAVKGYFAQVVSAQLEVTLMRQFHKKLKTLCGQLARHLVSKYEVTLEVRPSIKNEKEEVIIRLDDKNLYKLQLK